MTIAEAKPDRAQGARPPPPGPEGRDPEALPARGEGDKEPPFIARMEGVPLDLVLTTFRGRVRIEVDEASDLAVFEAAFRIDGGAWHPLERVGRRLRGHFDADKLAMGAHQIELRARLVDGTERTSSATFRVRSSSG